MDNRNFAQEISDEEAAELAKDYQVSEADEQRIMQAVEQLHAICVELKLPLLACVALKKVEQEDGTAVQTKLAGYLPASRVPDFMHTAQHILEDGIDIPCGLLKVFKAMG